MLVRLQVGQVIERDVDDLPGGVDLDEVPGWIPPGGPDHAAG